MTELIQDLLAWIGANPSWAYLVVFLTALSESLAVIGMLIPGASILVGAGALVATGTLGFWPTCLAAVLGAIIGDALSYLLGRHYQNELPKRWPFRRYPEQLEQGIVFFERWGSWSVVIGRFFGPARAMVPLVAGMLRMAPARYFLANVLSAIAWGPAYLLPGIIAGATLQLAAEATLRLVLLGVLLLALAWLTLWLARRLFRLLSPHAANVVQRLLSWADVHPHAGRIAQALADPTHPAAATLAGLAAALLLATATAALAIAAGTGAGGGEIALNRMAMELASGLQSPPADQLLNLLGRLASPAVLALVIIAVLALLIRQGRARHARYWLAATGFGLVAVPLLGWSIAIPRPDSGIAFWLPWSFPSAPVLLASLTYGFLAISLARAMPASQRWLPYGLAALLILAAAGARLYFAAEWASDLIASIALGVAWISALGLAFRSHDRSDADWRSLATVAVLAGGLGFVASGWLAPTLGTDLRRAPPATIALSREHWLAEQWQALPSHRADLRHRETQPLPLQSILEPATLHQALTAAGWRPAERLGWRNLPELFTPSLALMDLPMVPHLHSGEFESFAWMREHGDDERLVLRLWPTPYRIDGDRALWIGGLTTQVRDDLLGVMVLPITTDEIPDPSETLGDILKAFEVTPIDKTLLIEPRSEP